LTFLLTPCGSESLQEMVPTQGGPEAFATG
jgi:hypothetical protein